MKMRSWEVSEKFWGLVEPLIPERRRPRNRKYRRKEGGGRKAMEPRKVFEAIVFVLRTGIQWKALSKERFGSASSIHAYFKKWEKAGVFERIWKAGLAEYDELEGIAWEWQSMDGAMVKAPLGKESVGPNPTDRVKKWEQKAHAGRRAWRPVVDRRHRGQQARLHADGRRVVSEREGGAEPGGAFDADAHDGHLREDPELAPLRR